MLFEKGQILQIGPIQLPIQWIVLLVALFISTWITEQIARKKGWEKERWSDSVLTFVIIVIIVYKFGGILFNLKQVIQNPQLIIWTTGTNLSLLMGIILGIVYFVIHAKRKKLHWLDSLNFLWITMVITLFLFTFLIKDEGRADQPINLYRAIWLGFLLVTRFSWWKQPNQTQLMVLYIGLGFGLLILSMFNINLQFVYGLTQEQWIALIPVLVGIVGLFNKKEGNHS